MLFRKYIDKVVKQHCVDNLQTITVEPLQGVFNERCFWNACEYASKHRGCSVVEVIYNNTNGNSCCLHYVVEKDGRYFEVSVGYLSKYYDYYFMRNVAEHEWGNISRTFDKALDEYKEEILNPFQRLLTLGERIL